MSFNIYEDPDLTMNVRYSKSVREDGGDGEERRVDIYESAEPFTDRRDRRYVGTRGAQKHPAAEHRNPFRAAALGLGLLCLLLVVGLTVLSVLFISVFLEKHELSDRYEKLQTSYENRKNSYCQLQGTESQTQTNIIGWKRHRCSCYYKSAERKNWTESRSDCQSRDADLVVINNKEEHDFVGELNEHGASWIGLHSVTTDGWQKDSWKWKWVDGSSPAYLPWQEGVNIKPEERSTAYMEQRTLKHTNSGSKQWICERQMY